MEINDQILDFSDKDAISILCKSQGEGNNEFSKNQLIDEDSRASIFETRIRPAHCVKNPTVTRHVGDESPSLGIMSQHASSGKVDIVPCDL